MDRLRRHCIRQAHRWCFVVACMAMLVIAGGCGSTAAGPIKTVAQRQQADQLLIGLELPERPQLLEEQDAVISLTDAAGKPVNSAEVWLALIMPTMRMSPNEPDAIEVGNGRYQTKAIFTMSGVWTIEVHATVEGQEHIATFHAQSQ